MRHAVSIAVALAVATVAGCDLGNREVAEEPEVVEPGEGYARDRGDLPAGLDEERTGFRAEFDRDLNELEGRVDRLGADVREGSGEVLAGIRQEMGDLEREFDRLETATPEERRELRPELRQRLDRLEQQVDRLEREVPTAPPAG